jgi:hypothetical protein
MPLYIVEALVVELVALRVSTRRPLTFGLAAGAGIATFGLAAEWAWSHVWMPLPWPSELLPEALLLGVAGAVAGAVLGAWIGHRLSLERRPGLPSLRLGALAAAVVVALCVVVALDKPSDRGVRAAITLTDVAGPPQRTVDATVRVRPASAADGAEWLTVTAWQGDGLIVDRLRRVGPGTYRTTQPIPVHGTWKSMVRLHRGRSLIAAPLYLPRDVAIPPPRYPPRRASPGRSRPTTSCCSASRRRRPAG